jgi:hypothetical protein
VIAGPYPPFLVDKASRAVATSGHAPSWTEYLWICWTRALVYDANPFSPPFILRPRSAATALISATRSARSKRGQCQVFCSLRMLTAKNSVSHKLFGTCFSFRVNVPTLVRYEHAVDEDACGACDTK